MGKIVCMLLSVTLFVSTSPLLNVYAQEDSEILSDRECAILSSFTYCNDQSNMDTILKNEEFVKRCAKAEVSQSELIGFKNVDSIINLRKFTGSSFSVNTYQKGNNIVVAFRGTDEGIIQENLSYFISAKGHEQAKYAKEYIDKLSNKEFVDENTKIYITGHSLGGYLALYATGELLHLGKLEKNFIKCVTFNGLGISYSDPYNIQDALKKLNDNQLINYRIHGDLVSKIGKHFTKFINLDKIPQKIAMTENPHKIVHFLGQPLSREMNTPDKNGDDQLLGNLIISMMDICSSFQELVSSIE